MPTARRCITLVLSLLCISCAHRDAAARVPDPPATPVPSPAPTRAAATVAPAPLVTLAPAAAPAVTQAPSLTLLQIWLAPTPPPELPQIVLPPIVLPTPTPAPTPTPQPTMPVLPPDAMPQIVAVSLPSGAVWGGETVTGEVRASSNVASVELRVANYSTLMEKIAPGDFTVAVTVPRLPFFLRHRTYWIEIIARNTRGDAVTQSYPVTLR